MHRNALELDADFDYCPKCKKAVIGGLTADEYGIAHVCSLDIDSPRPEHPGSLHKRQPSSSTGFLSLLFLVGNVCLTIYSHLGLSAQILSNIPPSVYANLAGQPCGDADSLISNSTVTCSRCNENDFSLYFAQGQMQGTDALSKTCGISCNVKMLNGPQCGYECVRAAGYSDNCAYCFGIEGHCVATSCLVLCAGNLTTPGCRSCVESNCLPEFRNGTGFPIPVYDPNNSSWNAPLTISTAAPTSSVAPTAAVSATTIFYGIPNYGQISFVYSVRRAYLAGAQALAIIVVLASGVWPYTKCLLMFIAWFVPMSNRACTRILRVVCWLGRFSLVDVLVVLLLCIGVDFDLLHGYVQVKTESGPAIVAFGCVAIWALIQGEWMLKIQLRGELRANNYKGFETRSQAGWKRFWDWLGSGTIVCLLAAICFGVVIAALAGPGYDFVIDDTANNSTGIPRRYSLGSILSDVQIVDFPAIICLVFVIMIPVVMPVLVVGWALSGMGANLGLNLLQLGRMCCMDVFFISSIILGAEYGVLIPAVVSGVSPCYKITAESHMGFGTVLCIIHGLVTTLLLFVIEHNVHWTLSPPLPYKIERIGPVERVES